MRAQFKISDTSSSYPMLKVSFHEFKNSECREDNAAKEACHEEQESLAAWCLAAAQDLASGSHRGHGHTDPRGHSARWRASAFTWAAFPSFSAVEVL